MTDTSVAITVDQVSGIVLSDLARVRIGERWSAGFLVIRCGKQTLITNPAPLTLSKTGEATLKWKRREPLAFSTWTPSMGVQMRLLLFSTHRNESTSTTSAKAKSCTKPRAPLAFASGRLELSKVSWRLKSFSVVLSLNLEELNQAGSSGVLNATCSVPVVRLAMRVTNNKTSGERRKSSSGALESVSDPPKTKISFRLPNALLRTLNRPRKSKGEIWEKDVLAEGKEPDDMELAQAAVSSLSLPSTKANEKKKQAMLGFGGLNSASGGNDRSPPTPLRFQLPTDDHVRDVFEKVRSQITSTAADKTWSSVLTTQFGSEDYFATLESNQFIAVFRKLGVVLSKHEWNLFVNHFEAQRIHMRDGERILVHDINCFLLGLDSKHQAVTSLTSVRPAGADGDDELSETDEDDSDASDSGKHSKHSKHATASNLHVGDRVLAAYMGTPTLAKGIVKHVHRDGNAAVRFSNGSFENHISRQNIHRTAQAVQRSRRRRNGGGGILGDEEKDDDDDEYFDEHNMDGRGRNKKQNNNKRRVTAFWEEDSEPSDENENEGNDDNDDDQHVRRRFGVSGTAWELSSDDNSDGVYESEDDEVMSEGSAQDVLSLIVDAVQEDNKNPKHNNNNNEDVNSLEHLTNVLEREAGAYDKKARPGKRVHHRLRPHIPVTVLSKAIAALSLQLSKAELAPLVRRTMVFKRRDSQENRNKNTKRNDSNAVQVDWRMILRLLDRRMNLIHGIPGTDANKSVHKVLHKIRRCVRQVKRRGQDATEPFVLLDPQACGLLGFQEFARACAMLGCTVLASDIRSLDQYLRLVAPNTPAKRIQYRELFRILLPDVFAQQRQGATPDTATGRLVMDPDAALDRLVMVFVFESKIRMHVVALDMLIEKYPQFDPQSVGSMRIDDLGKVFEAESLQVCKDDLNALALKFASNVLYVDANESGGKLRQVDYKRLCKELDTHTDEMLAAVIQPQLQQAWRVRGAHAWETFQKVDPDRTGSVPAVQFRHTLVAALGVRITEHDLGIAIRRFSASSSSPSSSPPLSKSNNIKNDKVPYSGEDEGGVEYTQFLRTMGEKAGIGGLGLTHAGDVSLLEAKLRHAIRAEAAAGKDFDVSRVFAKFDTSKSGAVSVPQFAQGLSDLGIKVAPHEMTQLLIRFTIGGGGLPQSGVQSNSMVDFASFVRFAGFTAEEMNEIARRVGDTFSQHQRNGVDHRAAFAVWDVAGTGFITTHEFRVAARLLRLPVTEAELHAVMKRFAQFNDDSFVGYTDFLRFVGSFRAAAQARARADDAVATTLSLHNKHASSSSKRNHGKRNGTTSKVCENDDGEQQGRLAVDGNGFDGLGFSNPLAMPIAATTRTEPNSHETKNGRSGSSRSIGKGKRSKSIPLCMLDKNKSKVKQQLVSDENITQWLQQGASKRERSEFLTLFKSMRVFQDSSNTSPDFGNGRDEHAIKMLNSNKDSDHTFVNHSSKTIGRVVNAGCLVLSDNDDNEDSPWEDVSQTFARDKDADNYLTRDTRKTQRRQQHARSTRARAGAASNKSQTRKKRLSRPRGRLSSSLPSSSGDSESESDSDVLASSSESSGGGGGHRSSSRGKANSRRRKGGRCKSTTKMSSRSESDSNSSNSDNARRGSGSRRARNKGTGRKHPSRHSPGRQRLSSDKNKFGSDSDGSSSNFEDESKRAAPRKRCRGAVGGGYESATDYSVDGFESDAISLDERRGRGESKDSRRSGLRSGSSGARQETRMVAVMSRSRSRSPNRREMYRRGGGGEVDGYSSFEDETENERGRNGAYGDRSRVVSGGSGRRGSFDPIANEVNSIKQERVSRRW